MSSSLLGQDTLTKAQTAYPGLFTADPTDYYPGFDLLDRAKVLLKTVSQQLETKVGAVNFDEALWDPEMEVAGVLTKLFAGSVDHKDAPEVVYHATVFSRQLRTRMGWFVEVDDELTIEAFVRDPDLSSLPEIPLQKRPTAATGVPTTKLEGPFACVLLHALNQWQHQSDQ